MCWFHTSLGQFFISLLSLCCKAFFKDFVSPSWFPNVSAKSSALSSWKEKKILQNLQINLQTFSNIQLKLKGRNNSFLQYIYTSFTQKVLTVAELSSYSNLNKIFSEPFSEPFLVLFKSLLSRLLSLHVLGLLLGSGESLGLDSP